MSNRAEMKAYDLIAHVTLSSQVRNSHPCGIGICAPSSYPSSYHRNDHQYHYHYHYHYHHRYHHITSVTATVKSRTNPGTNGNRHHQGNHRRLPSLASDEAEPTANRWAITRGAPRQVTRGDERKGDSDTDQLGLHSSGLHKFGLS